MSDVKFRKLTRILVHGKSVLCREVFKVASHNIVIWHYLMTEGHAEREQGPGQGAGRWPVHSQVLLEAHHAGAGVRPVVRGRVQDGWVLCIRYLGTCFFTGPQARTGRWWWVIPTLILSFDLKTVISKCFFLMKSISIPQLKKKCQAQSIPSLSLFPSRHVSSADRNSLKGWIKKNLYWK